MNTKLVGKSRTRTEQLYSKRVLVQNQRGIVENVGRQGVDVMEGRRGGRWELRTVVERVWGRERKFSRK